ncbi:hypothetical protein DBV23_18160 [Edwardsiella ictaluri]|uniref:Uncharacterized protein n=1 Tax=Edwardsiella ictaluri (strain 93-146) TaxID=634503 RepID=C5BE16_EDWI9|nr:hypothetical protein [Edwardsiella ictaluri]ACR68935.1 hypothetical protein NT01EI_1756 [Edwardsiella ictaluri 93-146]AVZ83934.1 hypothetical protein DBV23_18160 [Edwardsiella ictaluri]UCQ49147.1 hypothetical protein DB741_08030 [Edwardsiella ictaluri]UCQ52403.1 hypothetical protein DB731_08010 [Edwardsiella ictaluri]UYB63096.1 hypothetical protein N8I66_08170 [Edwardsiella ictaluri]
MGAHQTLNVSESPSVDTLREKILALIAGTGANFAFRCNGMPQAAAAIWAFIRHDGELCEMGCLVNMRPCTRFCVNAFSQK